MSEVMRCDLCGTPLEVVGHSLVARGTGVINCRVGRPPHNMSHQFRLTTPVRIERWLQS